jgi:DNA recombination protein RmuC
VLERILEESGLREGHEYDIQSTLSDEEGKKFRPDVIVHLPQNKDIIIDSKVSLVAYDAFVRAQSDEERSHALKQHLLSIHSHIKGLSGKRYEQLGGVRTLDFVLLFMPIEGAFLLALEQDNTFFKSAYEQNIVVVSPSTLLVTLRTIEHIWRSEYQERNAKAIAESAEALYEKLVAFVEDMEKIGEQIGRWMGSSPVSVRSSFSSPISSSSLSESPCSNRRGICPASLFCWTVFFTNSVCTANRSSPSYRDSGVRFPPTCRRGF